jgi:hypothetical protein
VFTIDIILGFITTVIDSRGKESYDSRLIYMIYTNTRRFYLDVLSLFGAGIFERISIYFANFGYIKMLRVFRLSDMIAKTNVDEATKAILKLLKLMFYLFFMLHVLGCYLWIAVGYNAPEKFYVNLERTMYISDEDPSKHLYWDPIICVDPEYCKCGEGTFNIIYAKLSEYYEIDYEDKSDGFQERIVNLRGDEETECRKFGMSDSCFCDPVVEYDLLWGPMRTIGDIYWPDGPPEEAEDLAKY